MRGEEGKEGGRDHRSTPKHHSRPQLEGKPHPRQLLHDSNHHQSPYQYQPPSTATNQPQPPTTNPPTPNKQPPFQPPTTLDHPPPPSPAPPRRTWFSTASQSTHTFTASCSTKPKAAAAAPAAAATQRQRQRRRQRRLRGSTAAWRCCSASMTRWRSGGWWGRGGRGRCWLLDPGLSCLWRSDWGHLCAGGWR